MGQKKKQTKQGTTIKENGSELLLIVCKVQAMVEYPYKGST